MEKEDRIREKKVIAIEADDPPRRKMADGLL